MNVHEQKENMMMFAAAYKKLEEYKNMLITAHAVKRACGENRTIPPNDKSLRHLAETYIEVVHDLEATMQLVSVYEDRNKRLKRQQDAAVKEATKRVESLYSDMQTASAGNMVMRLFALTKLYFQELWFILKRGKVAPLVPTGRTGEAWREADNSDLPNLN